MKRKTVALLLALTMCLSLLSACGADSKPDGEPSTARNTSGPTEQQPDEKEEQPSQEPDESAEPTQKPEQEQPEESEKPEPAVPARVIYTFDVATGTLTCSGGGEVTRDWLDVVKNALFETDDYRARDEVKKVVVERGITSIGFNGYGAFEGCGYLAEAILPDTLTSIGQRAFYETALTNIVIPESVTELGADMFVRCKNLASADLPDGLTEIPGGLFYGCTSTHGNPFVINSLNKILRNRAYIGEYRYGEHLIPGGNASNYQCGVV